MSEALNKAMDALYAHERWHKDHDGYEGSDLQEQTDTAITAIYAALAQPPAPTAQPAATKVLIERLHARTESPPCNADGTYTVGNCRPDALCQEAATEIERLCAAAAIANGAASPNTGEKK